MAVDYGSRTMVKKVEATGHRPAVTARRGAVTIAVWVAGRLFLHVEVIAAFRRRVVVALWGGGSIRDEWNMQGEGGGGNEVMSGETHCTFNRRGCQYAKPEAGKGVGARMSPNRCRVGVRGVVETGGGVPSPQPAPLRRYRRDDDEPSGSARVPSV